MNAMRWTLVIGAIVSALTFVVGGEAVRAFGPFAVLTTGVLLLAYWAVACDRTPVTHAGEKTKAA
jgi:hypothetical protein